MSKRVDVEALVLWLGIALVVYEFHGAAGAGGVFIAASLLSSWVDPHE